MRPFSLFSKYSITYSILTAKNITTHRVQMNIIPRPNPKAWLRIPPEPLLAAF